MQCTFSTWRWSFAWESNSSTFAEFGVIEYNFVPFGFLWSRNNGFHSIENYQSTEKWSQRNRRSDRAPGHRSDESRSATNTIFRRSKWCGDCGNVQLFSSNSIHCCWFSIDSIYLCERRCWVNYKSAGIGVWRGWTTHHRSMCWTSTEFFISIHSFFWLSAKFVLRIYFKYSSSSFCCRYDFLLLASCVCCKNSDIIIIKL